MQSISLKNVRVVNLNFRELLCGNFWCTFCSQMCNSEYRNEGGREGERGGASLNGEKGTAASIKRANFP